MKRLILFLAVLVLAAVCVVPAGATDGTVTYSGNAGQFVFAPGSAHSLTDLFPEFKNVMPGDTLTQKITVKNDADNKVKVKVYIRSLGVNAGSEKFLSQLKLQVQKSADNKMAYMFDALADETAQLTDWVCLGMLYSGGEVNLDVTLSVPVELDNAFENQIGYLDWEFRIEEFPIEATDPVPPQTGDTVRLGLYIAVMAGSAIAIFLLLFARKKKTTQ